MKEIVYHYRVENCKSLDAAARIARRTIRELVEECERKGKEAGAVGEGLKPDDILPDVFPLEETDGRLGWELTHTDAQVSGETSYASLSIRTTLPVEIKQKGFQGRREEISGEVLTFDTFVKTVSD